MKAKSVVMSVAMAAASSVFAAVFDQGAIYTTLWATNETVAVELDSPLSRPVVFTNVNISTTYEGYSVTAAVSVVVHPELPPVPSAWDTRNPKGAICAAVAGDPAATNWYGLTYDTSSNVWTKLENITIRAEDNTDYVLAIEFKSSSKVRYWVDTQHSDWLDGRNDDVPKYTALAGLGAYTALSLRGAAAMPTVTKAAVNESSAFNFTNAAMSVTLESTDGFDNVGFLVKDSGGNVVYSGSSLALDNVAIEPGETYTYSVYATKNGATATNDVGVYVAAAPGGIQFGGFGAIVTNASSALVYGGGWEYVGGPEVADSSYDIRGREKFAVSNESLQGSELVVVDNKVMFTEWGNAEDLLTFKNGDDTISAITVITNAGGNPVWKVYDGSLWIDAETTGLGSPCAQTNVFYDIRTMFDFAAAKVAYSVESTASSGRVQLTYNGDPWISLYGSATTLSEVGYSGVGKLEKLVGGNADTNLAFIAGTSYATLADAMAVATNGNDTIMLRTNTQWPGSVAAGKYTILTNGFVLAGISESASVVKTQNGYTITLSSGLCAVGSGKLNLSAANLSAMGITSASDKSPAQITAELTAADSNGLEKWVNFVLGINGSESTNKPYAAPVQNASSASLTFKPGLVGAQPEGTGADVVFWVEEFASPSATESSKSSSTNAVGDSVEMTLDSSGVKYYRLNLKINLPD